MKDVYDINNPRGIKSKTTQMQSTLKKLLTSNNMRKILKKTNTSLKDVQFITLQEFIQLNQSSFQLDQQSDHFDYRDRYETQLSRRITQLKILLQMESIHFNHYQRNPSYKKNSNKQYDLGGSFQKNNKKKTNRKHLSNGCSNFSQIKSNRKERSKKKHSTQFSHLSRQSSNVELQTHRKIKQVETFQNFNEGKPYIDEYCKSARIDINKSELYTAKSQNHLPTSPASQQCLNQIGKIAKQIVVKKTQVIQNQSQLSPKKHKKQPKYWVKNNDQYEMIPLNNQKIKTKLSRKNLKNNEKQKEACKQLISEVKRFEQINKKCIKKLKSIDKNDLKSRQKILQVTSREKIIKKNNIEKLKDRITSKHQNNR